MKSGMRRSFVSGAAALLVAGFTVASCHAQEKPVAPKISVVSQGRAPDFPLATAQGASPIYLDAADFPVVQIAAEALAADIQSITKAKPRIAVSAPTNAPSAVFIGTLGKSRLIDGLVTAKKLDVSRLAGAWESFVVATVANPLPGVKQGLIIAGSDRRGTAYGVFSLSEAMGVSPWQWWADVTPHPQAALWVRSGAVRQGSPAVKYRGIFINDEDWGLQPWAAKTFEPETKDIGPKTYAKVCELLLRLKANYLWPAMHPSTRAFNFYPQNKVVADRYAIVMGSSHAEPLLRNNVDEWDPKKYGEWNYETNRAGVDRYWEEALQANGRYENVYSIGMRGIHDSAMPGPKDTAGKIKIMDQVFADQRELLSRYVNPDPTKVPQVFTAYKEVLDLYQKGLQVPEDVILNWPDDNYGYIRQLSNPQEQKRSGGAGVYYHVSYWGAPYDYLWLDSTPPALLWEEMSKAYDYGARSLWVLNVGDIKPAEKNIEFFLRLAWNPSQFGPDGEAEFLKQWATRDFGAQNGPAIAAILRQYYRLGAERRPEHMGWNLSSRTPVTRTDFSPVNYGDEANRRLDDYAAITAQAEAIYAKLPSDRRDSFYELVLYPVRCANWMNQKFLYTDRSFLYAAQGRSDANEWADKARQAYDKIQNETQNYNVRIAGGKWNNVISAAPRQLGVFAMPETAKFAPPAAAGLGVNVEGHVAVLSAAAPTTELEALQARWGTQGDSAPDTLPVFDAATKPRRFFDVFNTGTTPSEWTAAPAAPWIRLSLNHGPLLKSNRIWVDLDWSKVPAGENVTGTITVRGAGVERIVKVPVFNPAAAKAGQLPDFIEADGVVSIDADHFTRRTDKGAAGWRTITGLGRSGNAVAVFPTTTASVQSAAEAKTGAPSLEYDFWSFTTGPASIRINALPTFRVHPGRGLRYAVALDDAEPVVVDLEKAGKWEEGVLQNSRVGVAPAAIDAAGKHTLKIWMMDPGVVLDKIVMDLGGLKPSYLGPPETRVMRSATG